MTRPSDDLEEVYDRRAALEYAAPVREEWAPKFVVLMATLASYLPASSFLDVGCGDGRHLAALAARPDRPARLVGSDISSRILETAHAAAPEAELVRANLEQLPFPDASFDLVLCTQVIEHLLDPDLGARELARVLAPGGVLVLSTDNRRNRLTRVINAPRRLVVRLLRAEGRHKNVEFPHRDFTAEELRTLVEDAGLSVERMRTFRFTVMGAPRWLVRLNGQIDRLLPDIGQGDILLCVARR